MYIYETKLGDIVKFKYQLSKTAQSLMGFKSVPQKRMIKNGKRS